MKLAHIGSSSSSTKIINLDDLKDQDGNDFELPPDPENNLVFDPRPIRLDRHGWEFDIEIQDSVRLVVTCTVGGGWWDLYLRAYNRTKEDIPVAFDSSVPYEYWGLHRELIPHDTVVAKAHHTVTTIKKNACYRCEEMTTFDMSNAPVEEIHRSAFYECTSLRSILFSQVLKKIRHHAFSFCEAIDVLILPSTVTNIEDEVFQGDTDMRIFKLPDDIDHDYVAFTFILDCDALRKVLANQTDKQWFKFLRKVPPNQPHGEWLKRWLKHRYDPYPLHKVCYNAHVTIDEIQQCTQTHPHAAYLSDEFHMTALHMITIMACTSNLHVHNQSHNQDQDKGASRLLVGTGHITACFDANMSAAFVQDDRGKTPLDYLLESCDGLDVHTALVTSLCLHRSSSSLYQMTGIRHHLTTCWSHVMGWICPLHW